jgi:hypothetical protein
MPCQGFLGWACHAPGTLVSGGPRRPLLGHGCVGRVRGGVCGPAHHTRSPSRGSELRLEVGDGQEAVRHREATRSEARHEDPPESDTDDFEATVRDVTNEPLLGPRQAAFVDALIERLRTGPPMSDAEATTQEQLASLLGLPL